MHEGECYTRAMSPDLKTLILNTEEFGLKLERMGRFCIWHSDPSYVHQTEIDRIRSSFGTFGTQLQVSSVWLSFVDGSFTCPDIAVLARAPTSKEAVHPLEHVPEAVVEVISEGFEAKDLEIGPHFYLSQGVKDVIVFDPRTLIVLHYRRDGTHRLTSPHSFALECGCVCVV